jgi:acyl dehydratase
MDQYFEDFEIGSSDVSDSFVASRSEMLSYARENDPWPIHVDEEFARGSVFGDITASFGYVLSLFFRAVHSMPSNRAIRGDAFLGAVAWENVRFRKAVMPDDRLTVRATTIAKQLGRNGDRGTITSHWEIVNQDNAVVIDLDIVSLYRTRPS